MDAAAIEALESRRYAAMTGPDLTALTELLHDDLIYTHSSGVVDTKASYLDALASGRLRYQSAVCSDTSVRLLGTTALVAGRSAIEIVVSGTHKALRLRFLAVWTETPAGWRFIAWQSAALAA